MNENPTSNTQQTIVDEPSPLDHPLAGFFGIGLAINLILLAAYIIWAYRQWIKNKKHND